MGKKKKKGLSNRLAKMSDDERARYLQHRAAVEEEAKRRKEQLIATYIKNKIKKEDAFTRLNVAKINEYWHQILRKIAFKNMRLEIMNLSDWIKKVVDIKNTLLNKLTVEIDESEEQYQRNLESHLSFIDQFMDIHHDRQEDLQSDFEGKSTALLHNAKQDMNNAVNKSNKELDYLKTIFFALQTNLEDTAKNYHNHHEAILEDHSTSFRAEQESMVNGYIRTMDKIWQDIHRTLSEYLGRTTVRRHHYIELKHLDDRNKAERQDNDRKIAKYSNLINSMKIKHAELQEKTETKLQLLSKQHKELSQEYTSLKRKLTSTLAKDEKRLIFMTEVSNNANTELLKIMGKGDQILQILTYCRRLETEEEKRHSWPQMRTKWMEMQNIFYGQDFGEDSAEKTEGENESREEEEDSKEEERKERDLKEEEEVKDSTQFGSKDSKSMSPDSAKDQPQKTEEIKVELKDTHSIQPSISPTNIIDSRHYLDGLKNLAWVHNRVEIDIMELKKERSKLIAENNNMKDIIKGILEDAVLEPPPPKVPVMKIRPNISSAPASLGSGKWATKLPNCVAIEFS